VVGAGGFYDSAGTYHFGQRNYDPRLGRWTQADPLNQPDDLRQANRYAYVGGNPVNFVDPTGLVGTELGRFLNEAEELTRKSFKYSTRATGVVSLFLIDVQESTRANRICDYCRPDAPSELLG
jgi:RHS repeat-associated protein